MVGIDNANCVLFCGSLSVSCGRGSTMDGAFFNVRLVGFTFMRLPFLFVGTVSTNLSTKFSDNVCSFSSSEELRSDLSDEPFDDSLELLFSSSESESVLDATGPEQLRGVDTVWDI